MRMGILLALLLLVGCNQNYWHVVKENDTWWLISPDNKKHFLNTVTTVQPYQISRDGVSYYSKDFSGDLENWALKTSGRA